MRPRIKEKTNKLICIRGSVGYKSEGKALEVLKLIQDREANSSNPRSRVPIRAYKCESFCPWWHLTAESPRDQSLREDAYLREVRGDEQY